MAEATLQTAARAGDVLSDEAVTLARVTAGTGAPRTIVGQTLGLGVQAAQRLGVFDKVRRIVVRLTANPGLQEFRIGDEVIPIQRYLNSGMAGDAYVIRVDGREMVLKIAKPTVAARRSMFQANQVNQFLRENTDLRLPVLDSGLTHPDGHWQVMEFVEGRQLDKYIADVGGWENVPPEVRQRLESFHRTAEELHRRAGLTLDISADNIFIRDGQPVLVDFGTIPSEHGFASDFTVARSRWVAAGQDVVLERAREAQRAAQLGQRQGAGRVPSAGSGSCLGSALRGIIVP